MFIAKIDEIPSMTLQISRKQYIQKPLRITKGNNSNSILIEDLRENWTCPTELSSLNKVIIIIIIIIIIIYYNSIGT